MSHSNDLILVYKKILKGERHRFSNGTWHNDNNIRVVVKYLLEEILKWNKRDIKNNLNWYILVEYKLAGLLSDHRFKGSPYKIINFVYPDEILPWELKKSPLHTWDDDNIKKAVNWLFNTKLKWSKEDICKKLKAETFMKNNLDGLLQFFNGSPYDVLEFVYPNEFKPWELKNIPWKIVNKDSHYESFLCYISDKENIKLSDINLDTIKKYFLQFTTKNSKAFRQMVLKAESFLSSTT